MNAITATVLPLLQRLPGAEGDIDDSGSYTTTHWLWPAQAELIYGGLASIIVFSLLIWKAGPMAKQAFQARTERIQHELDESAQAKTDADAEAARIRQALGDIEAERQRLLAEADEQAELLLTDGRARLDAELADMEAMAETDNAAAASRTMDELRNEVARLAAAATERVVEQSLDDSTQQALVEDYISRVGAGAPA